MSQVIKKLHPIVEGQIHAIKEPEREDHTPGKCYVCDSTPFWIVESAGQKWLSCEECAA